MNIVAAKVIVTCPDRNFVTLKLTTDDGLTGVGDATLNGRELAVASYLQDHVCPLLIGRDAGRIEDTWQYLHKGAYWRRGPVTMTAVAAVDTALWDIKGKAAGMPVYQLIGGRSRDAVTVYGHANGATVPDVLEQVGGLLDGGYRGVRVQVGIPGLGKVYGVPATGEPYEPAIAGERPQEETWSTPRYLNFIPSLFEAVRDRFGYDFHLLHDVHHRLTPIEAARLGKAVEPYGLFWLEDPISEELQDGFRLIRQHTTTPIAVGEVYNSIWDCRQLIVEQLIDYIRMDVVHGGGITHLRRVVRPGRPPPRTDRVARRQRPVTGVPGRRPARRHRRAQLRHPGVHAAHRGHRRRLPAHLSLRRRAAVPLGGARSRRRHRRGGGRRTPLPAGLPAGQPS